MATKNHAAVVPAATGQGFMTREDQLPEWMRGKAGQGLEQIRPEDVEVPRLKLLQALSPELKQSETMRAGQWMHSITEQGFGNKIRVIPLYADQSYILWRPRKSGGGILARAMDGIHWTPSDGVFNVKLDNGKDVTWKTATTVAKSGLAEWGSTDPSDPNSAPAATRMYNLVVLPIDFMETGPAVVTMQRSSIRVARKLFSQLKLARAPLYGLVFDLSSDDAKNSAAQEFMIPKWTQTGILGLNEFSDDRYKELFAYGENLYEQYKEWGLKIRDIESLQAEAGETPTDGEGGKPSDGNRF